MTEDKNDYSNNTEENANLILKRIHIKKIDESKNQIVIESSKGSTVIIDDKKGTIEMQDYKHCCTILLTPDGLHISSKKNINFDANGEISFNAKQIKMSSKGKTTIKAKGNLDLAGLSITNQAHFEYKTNALIIKNLSKIINDTPSFQNKGGNDNSHKPSQFPTTTFNNNLFLNFDENITE